jgi:hypothetical protein
VESFELETPAVKVAEVDALLTDKDIQVSPARCREGAAYSAVQQRYALPCSVYESQRLR